MLKRIIIDDVIIFTESPASPPMFSADADGQDAPMIPHGSIVAWKLIAIDDIPAPHSNIDAGVLQVRSFHAIG